MKAFFLSTFVILLALSALAWTLTPQPVARGKTRLVWTSDDNPNQRERIDPFNQLYPHLHLMLDPSNAGMDKVIIQSLGGVGPDLFDCWAGFHLSAFVRAGIAWDITDELARRGIDVRSETWTAVHPDCIYEGRIYGYPMNAAVNGIWYHKDILKEAGIELPRGPWTWEQLVPIAKKLTVRSGSRITRYGIMADWDSNFQQFILQWGGDFYNEDGTRCTIDSPQAIAAVQFMHDLVYKHGVSPTPVEEAAMASAGGWGGGAGSSITLFGAKKGAMALGGRWWLVRLRDKEFKDLRLGAAEAPHGAVRTFLGYGKATLINKNSPRREEALHFLEYLRSEPYNRLINRQADGVGPVKKYVEQDDFLHDPDHPHEDFNYVWRDMMELAVPEQVSPFINGAVALRIIRKQLDLIKANEKPVDVALRDAARQVNKEIEKNLRRTSLNAQAQ